MKGQRVEARVLKQHGATTDLLIRAGDAVVQATYSELAPCEFPIWTPTPVQVEVPFDGVKRHVAGLSSESFPHKLADGGLPNTVKFPVYSHQAASTLEAYEHLGRGAHGASRPGSAMSREPLVALGVSASGYTADDLRIEFHCVLPFWPDDTAVLVTLNWYDGEPNEGTPNPEWYLRGTEGMPFEQGLRSIQELSLLPAHLTNQRYNLTVSPWKLGETLLNDPGHEVNHKIWQREWRFSSLDAFNGALARVCDGLLGQVTTEEQSLAGQRA